MEGTDAGADPVEIAPYLRRRNAAIAGHRRHRHLPHVPSRVRRRAGIRSAADRPEYAHQRGDRLAVGRLAGHDDQIRGRVGQPCLLHDLRIFPPSPHDARFARDGLLAAAGRSHRAPRGAGPGHGGVLHADHACRRPFRHARRLRRMEGMVPARSRIRLGLHARGGVRAVRRLAAGPYRAVERRRADCIGNRRDGAGLRAQRLRGVHLHGLVRPVRLA